jgi:hypothetical protein
MTDWSSSDSAHIEPVLDTPTACDTDAKALAQALVHQRANWLVSRAGPHDLRALSECLHAACQALAPTLRILHFSARQPAAWLGHINEALARQGLAQAMQPCTDLWVQEICFVHDAQALTHDESSLLLPLNRHFPGWPMRWVLLLDSEQPMRANQEAWQQAHAPYWRLSGAHSLLTATPAAPQTPGPAPVHEAPPAPAPAPAPTPEPVIQTVAAPPAAPADEREPGPVPIAPVPTPARLGEPTAHLPLRDPASAPRPTPAGSSRPRQPVGLWTLGLLSLLALGAWVVAHRPPQGSGLPSPLTSSVPTAPANPAASAPPTGSAVPNPDTQVLAEEATVVASPQAPDASDPVAASGLAALEPAIAAPPELEVPPVPEVLRRDLRWLSSLPKDSFVLERGVFDTVQQAQRLIKSQDELATARIIMLRPGLSSAARFLVVTGPFRSLERAQNFRFRLQLPSQAQIEPVDVLLEKSMPLGAAP